MTIRPRDTGPYFDQVQSRVALAAAPTALCKEDPERVSLLVSVEVAASTANAGILPNAAVGIGILISQNERLDLVDSLHGPIVQKAWFATSGAAINVTVIEQFLRRYPPGADVP